MIKRDREISKKSHQRYHDIKTFDIMSRISHIAVTGISRLGIKCNLNPRSNNEN